MNGTVVLRAYVDWCSSCQQSRAADQRTADEARRVREAADLKAASELIPQLLSEFRSRPFVGARPRDWVQVIEKGPGFLNTAMRYKRIPRSDEPAVPIGHLRWHYYLNRTHPDISDQEQTAMLETGLTASGEFVPMDLEPMHSRWGHHDYRLVAGQQREICTALERLLAN